MRSARQKLQRSARDSLEAAMQFSDVPAGNLYETTVQRVEAIRDNPVVQLERVEERVEAAVLQMAVGTHERAFMDALRLFGKKFAGGVGLGEADFWVDGVVGTDALTRIILKRLRDQGLLERARVSVAKDEEEKRKKEEAEEEAKRKKKEEGEAGSAARIEGLLDEAPIGYNIAEVRAGLSFEDLPDFSKRIALPLVLTAIEIVQRLREARTKNPNIANNPLGYLTTRLRAFANGLIIPFVNQLRGNPKITTTDGLGKFLEERLRDDKFVRQFMRTGPIDERVDLAIRDAAVTYYTGFLRMEDGKDSERPIKERLLAEMFGNPNIDPPTHNFSYEIGRLVGVVWSSSSYGEAIWNAGGFQTDLAELETLTDTARNIAKSAKLGTEDDIDGASSTTVLGEIGKALAADDEAIREWAKKLMPQEETQIAQATNEQLRAEVGKVLDTLLKANAGLQGRDTKTRNDLVDMANRLGINTKAPLETMGAVRMRADGTPLTIENASIAVKVQAITEWLKEQNEKLEEANAALLKKAEEFASATLGIDLATFYSDLALDDDIYGNSKLAAIIGKIEDELEERQKQADESAAEAEKFQKQATELLQTVESGKTASGELEARLAELDVAREQAAAARDVAESKLKSLQEEFEALQGEKSALEEQNKQRSQAYADLEAAKARADAQVAALQEAASEKGGQAKVLARQLQAAQAAQQEAQDQLRNAQEQLGQARKTNADLAREKAELERKLRTQEGRVLTDPSQAQEIANLRKQLSQKERELQASQGRVTQAENARSRLQTQLTAANQNAQDLERQVRKLEDELSGIGDDETEEEESFQFGGVPGTTEPEPSEASLAGTSGSGVTADLTPLMTKLNTLQQKLEQPSLPPAAIANLENLGQTASSLSGLLERLIAAVERNDPAEIAQVSRRAQAQASTASQQADIASRSMEDDPVPRREESREVDPTERLRVQKAKIDILRAQRELANVTEAQRAQARTAPASSTSAPAPSPLDRLRVQEQALRVAKERAELAQALREQREDREPAHAASAEPSVFDRLKLRQLMAEVRLTEGRARRAELEDQRQQQAQQAAQAAPGSSVQDAIQANRLAAQRAQIAAKRDQLKLEMEQYEFAQKQQQQAALARQQTDPEQSRRLAAQREQIAMKREQLQLEMEQYKFAQEQQKQQQAQQQSQASPDQSKRLAAQREQLALKRDQLKLEMEQYEFAQKQQEKQQQAQQQSQAGPDQSKRLAAQREQLALKRDQLKLEMEQYEFAQKQQEKRQQAQQQQLGGPDRSKLVAAQREQLALKRDQLKLEMDQYEFERKKHEEQEQREQKLQQSSGADRAKLAAAQREQLSMKREQLKLAMDQFEFERKKREEDRQLQQAQEPKQVDRAKLVAAQREQLTLKREQLELAMKEYDFEQKRIENERGPRQKTSEEVAALTFERQKRRLELQKMAIEMRVAEREAQKALAGPTARERQAEAQAARQSELKLRRDLIALQTEHMRSITARQEAKRGMAFEEQRLELERQKLQLAQTQAENELKRLNRIDPELQADLEIAKANNQADIARSNMLTAQVKLQELRQLEGFKQQQAALEVERRAWQNAQEKIKLQNAQDARRAKGPSEDEMDVLSKLLKLKGGRGQFRRLLDGVHIGALWDPMTLQYFVTDTFFSVMADVLSNVNRLSGLRPLSMRDTIVDTALQDQIMRLFVARYNNVRRASNSVGTTTGWEASGLMAGHALDGFLRWLGERYGGAGAGGARQISPFLGLDGKNPQAGVPLLLEGSRDPLRAQEDLRYHLKYTPNTPLVFVPSGTRPRGRSAVYMTGAM